MALIGALFHTAWPSGTDGRRHCHCGGRVPVPAVSRLDQARLDRFFYRDRLDYRRTLIEFGRTLTNEVHLEPMLASVMDRISQTLLVDRLAIFLEDEAHPGTYRLARSVGVRYAGTAGPEFSRSPRRAVRARLSLL